MKVVQLVKIIQPIKMVQLVIMIQPVIVEMVQVKMIQSAYCPRR